MFRSVMGWPIISFDGYKMRLLDRMDGSRAHSMKTSAPNHGAVAPDLLRTTTADRGASAAPVQARFISARTSSDVLISASYQ